MRTGASDVPSRGLGHGPRLDARLKRARQAHLRRSSLEWLEPRTLMAVLPMPQLTGDLSGVSTTGGNVSSPLVVVDRYNANHLVSIWVRNDPSLAPGNTTIVQGSYSNNGGQSWTNLGTAIAGALRTDVGIAPTANGTTNYSQTTNPQVAFDNAGNFYVLTQQSNASNSSGALVLKKFNFAGNAPVEVFDNVIRQYVSDPVFNPTLAVNDNQASFTDPTTGAVQTDPYAGNVWVGWSTNESAPTGNFVRSGFSWNSASIQVMTSSNGGATFSGATRAEGGGAVGNAWGRYTQPGGIFADATPKIVTAQGTAGAAGGYATVVWDNYGRASNFTTDQIQSNRVGGGYSYSVAANGGTINQATDPGGGAPFVPATTSFNVNLAVDPTRFTTLSKLTVDLTIRQTDMSFLQAVLTAPFNDPATGQPLQILLFSNARNTAGTIPDGQLRGVTGANLGIVGVATINNVQVPYGFIGATFDDSAARSINDRSGANSGYTSTYRTEAIEQPSGNLRSLQYLSNLGLTAAQLSGQWTLTVTNNRNNGTGNAAPQLNSWGITAQSGVTTLGSPSRVADTLVRGNQAGNFSRASAAAGPQGIGPAIDVAQDNTLGSFSRYQGRIYVTYVGYRDIRTAGQINPNDNTDIFLAMSDDGGQTWFSPAGAGGVAGLVNDDQGSLDGFSGANHTAGLGQIVGRAQFLPQVAVDQTTGSLVMSWRDGRDDSARARSSIYVAASIDGGASFSAQGYANPPEVSIDAITGKTVILNAAGDNFNNVDPAASAFGFGIQMGLAVGSGQMYVAWAGNQNNSHFDNSNAVRGDTFQAYVQRMTIAVGPRVIDSTQGVVGQPGDGVNVLRSADGGPVANAFVVTFDRPIDPDLVIAAGGATFTTADVLVYYKGVNASDTYIQVPVLSVVPVTGSRVGQFGYTQFLVTFDPWRGGATSGYTNLVGTYSYILRPTITDQVRVVTSYSGSSRNGNEVDQNADGIAGQDPLTTPFSGLTPGDAYVTPGPSRISAVTWGPSPTSLLAAPFSSKTLPLIVPGAHVADAWVTGGSGPDDLLLNGTTSSLYVRFDRDIQVSSFSPADVLQIMGPAGSLLGPQYFASDRTGQTIPAPASATTPGLLSSGLTVPSFGRTFIAAEVTVSLDLTYAPPSGLTVSLMAPDGTSTPLAVGGGGRYTFSVPTFNNKLIEGQWLLRISNGRSGSAGVLNSWSLSVKPLISTKPVNGDGTYARTFQIDFPTQSLSGTYTAQLGPNVADRYNQALDTNLNAGLDALRGEAVNVPTTSVAYNSGTVNQTLIGNRIDSTINVTDNFPIQGTGTTSGLSGLRLRLSLTTNNVAPLTAVLTYNPGSPGARAVQLFSNLVQGPGGGGFVDAVFDDAATSPITQNSPPYSGAAFNPQFPLLNAAGFLGGTSRGFWQLTILSSGGTTATLNSWSLLFEKPLPTTGLGEPVADRAVANFRILQSSATDPNNAVSRNTWSSVGPAPVFGSSGQVGALAQDPSDPSGNTFFVGGSSGGIWKTTNFLTTDPQGPTYVPLTDFGPTNGLNIGGIAVFPRNNDPNQSIVIASTGEGDTGSTGVGFLISKDGGATWNLYDSTVNVDGSGNLLPIASTARDRAFVGSTTFKVVVDPKATLQGQVVIYAAVSGRNGGLWRSLDTGNTWQQMKSGNATDVVLDPSSATGGGTDPNLQVVYGAFRGDGVYISPNRGQVWNIMAGGVGNPLIVDTFDDSNVAVGNSGVNPNGARGRIALAKPVLTGVSSYDQLYAGWLYAAVSNADGGFYGLFMTKDFGQNWVQVRIPTEPPLAGYTPAIPSNAVSLNDYTITNGTGNEALALAIDPTNPNVVYLGGFRPPTTATGMIRVDATKIWDAHNLTLFSSVAADGLTAWSSTGPVTIGSPVNGWSTQGDYLNYIRNPGDPFNASATRFVYNLNQFTNNGFGTEWIPFDAPLPTLGSLVPPGTSPDYHRLVTMIDPTTGLTRLVYGTNRGVWSVLDDDGKQLIGRSAGTTPTPGGDRNGNLQIAQFYYGAVQPSNAGIGNSFDKALFAGSSNDQSQLSSGTVLTNGSLAWLPTYEGASAGGVAFDPQGAGTLYQTFAPGSMPANQGTSFFRVNHVGRTFNLIQSSGGSTTPDPQWGPAPGATFAVNPLSGQQMIVSSSTGRIFATETQGATWFAIGEPSVFGSPAGYSQALAYGAPDPGAPGGIGNLGNFMYVGTVAGRIFLTRTAGGGTGNAWSEVSTGLDGSPVQRIIPSPVRGSHSAYAVTTTGVFYNADTVAAGSTWINVTGNLRNISYDIFGQGYNQTTDPNLIKLSQSLSLTAMAVDWRYSIPNSTTDPVGAGLHPVLYVSGDSGVFRSIDNGVTWSLYPSRDLDGSPLEGGLLPRTSATDLDLSLGAINADTGVPDLRGPLDPYTPTTTADPNLLLASTWGRGMFAIKSAPLTIPGTVRINPADISGTAPDGTPIVTTSQFRISGLSMTSGFNNATRITIFDQTDNRVIGGFNISDLTTNNAANWTDSFGNFALKVRPGAIPTNGVKVLKIYATDDTGSVGNAITLTITLNASDLGGNTAPVAPSLSLYAPDNTGVVPSQNYTNKTSPRLTGTTSAGSTVELFYRNSAGQFVPFSPRVTAATNSTGGFLINFPNMGDGAFTVVAVASNAIGSSSPSPWVTFQVKTAGPTAPPTLSLSPATDSGIVGDNITNVHKPIFVGTVGAANAGSTIRIYQPGSTATASATLLATTTADASGNYAVQLPLSLSNGRLYLVAAAVDPAGNPAPGNSPILATTIVATSFDYTGSARDQGVASSLSQSQSMLYLRNDGTGFGQWFTNFTPPSYLSPWFYNGTTLGSSRDVPVPGDFDGDGRNDLATFRTSDASWTVWRSSQGGLVFQFGTPGSSVPVAGNFDGPGTTQYGVFDVVNGAGVWRVTTPSGSIRQFGFGAAGDVPLVGDFLGLGYDQPAVYRPSTGQFIVLKADQTSDVVATLPANQIPVPGKYDNLYFHMTGQAYRTIPAVFDPTYGVFTIARPTGSYFPPQVVFRGGDIPVPADYAGAGWDLPAVYRPGTGQFLVKMDQTQISGADAEVTSFPTAVGAPIVPAAAPLAYRMLPSSSLVANAAPTPQRQTASSVVFTTSASASTTLGEAPAAKAAQVATTASGASTAPVAQAATVLPSLTFSASNAAGARQPWFNGTAAPGTTVALFLSGTGVAGSKKVGTATADSAGNYAFQLPAGFRNGSYTLSARAVGADGSSTPIADARFQFAPAARLRTPVRGRFARTNGAVSKPRATPAAAEAVAPQVVAVVSAASAAAPAIAPLPVDAFSQAIQSLDGGLPTSKRKKS